MNDTRIGTFSIQKWHFLTPNWHFWSPKGSNCITKELKGPNDTKTALFSPQIGAFWPQIGTSLPQTVPGGVKGARMTQNCPFLPQNRYLSARQEVVSRPRDGQIVVIAAGKLGEKSGISVKNKTPRTPSVPERPHKLPPNAPKSLEMAPKSLEMAPKSLLPPHPHPVPSQRRSRKHP